MKRKTSPLLLCFSLLIGNAFGQTDTVEGWSYAVLPCLSYNTDLGLHYGVYGNVFNFGRGDGCTYPRYKNYFNAEVSRYTKGQTLGFFQYDGMSPLHDISTTITAIYLDDPHTPFHGFNGGQDIIGKDNHNNLPTESPYQFIKRKLAHIDLTVKGTIRDGLYWIAGSSYWHYAPLRSLTDEPGQSLFAEYCAMGLVRQDEIQGGDHIELRGGLFLDTRKPNSVIPSQGVYATLFATISADLKRDRYNYAQLNATLAQFHPIGNDRWVLANQICFQGRVAGELPFYLLQNINVLMMKQTSSEGLGGMTTLRGVPASRCVGNSYYWMNTELRIRIFDFSLLRRHFSISTNPFFDMGGFVAPYRIDEQREAYKQRGLTIQTSKPYMSAGVGLKLIMNQNFVVGGEIAKAITLTGEDFPIGINLGLNYIF